MISRYHIFIKISITDLTILSAQLWRGVSGRKAIFPLPLLAILPKEKLCIYVYAYCHGFVYILWKFVFSLREKNHCMLLLSFGDALIFFFY